MLPAERFMLTLSTAVRQRFVKPTGCAMFALRGILHAALAGNYITVNNSKVNSKFNRRQVPLRQEEPRHVA
jgi:hypothetical protein